MTSLELFVIVATVLSIMLAPIFYVISVFKNLAQRYIELREKEYQLQKEEIEVKKKAVEQLKEIQ